jgi:hemoglobin/transferrin/lactoferrin receptor protein
MRRPFAFSVFVCLSSLSLSAASADTAPGDQQRDVADEALRTQELRKISVTATRGPREIDSVAGTVTVKTAAEIERELATDIRDLIRYEPGVSVSNSPARFGLAGFNIRGIDGNRVLIRIDDVRMADSFSIGAFSNARRNLVDLDAVKSVEIVRGAASALYGSDALGGVVSFVTKDPLDYLGQDRNSAVTINSGYQGDDDGWHAGSTLALGNETLSGLLLYTHRSGGETENQGGIDSQDRTRTRPNPQDYASDSALGKLVWNPGSDNTVRLTLDVDRSDVDTDVFSSVGVSGTVNTLSLQGNDRQERRRFAVAHEISAETAMFDSLDWRAYVQDSEVTQRTREQRFTTTVGPASTVRREREFTFDQSVRGAEVLLRKDLQLGGSEHLFTYGFDAAWTDTEQMRDGVQTNLASGVRTTVIQPDSFPVRDFPKTRTRQLAAYVQDEISIEGGRWMVVPGVRIDSFRLQPEPDDIFIADNPGVSTTDIDTTNVTPKLGVVRTVGENLSVFAQYARGFRSPPYDDVNLGFTNLAFGYTAIPNPDLEPETSNGYELGVRGSAQDSFFSVSTFYNDYEDFIESRALVAVIDDVQVFQSRNVSDARIYGAELRSGLSLGSVSQSLQAWNLKLSVAYARGEDRVNDVPLNSVDPLKAVLGIAFQPAQGAWGMQLVGTAVDRKSNVDVSNGQVFVPPGYFVLDLLVHANIGERLRINAGVFNLTDKKYWEWSDVRSETVGSTIIDRYSRPGLNASANAVFRF